MSNQNPQDDAKQGTVGKLKNAAQGAAHSAADLAGTAFDKASGVGNTGLNFLKEHPNLLKWLKPLGTAGLVNALEKVDIDSALETVREMQAQFPQESPAEISQRLILKKAIYAGGIGLATNAVPGVSLLLAPIDWTVSASLQAELAYQIAAAYGMDLRDPQRQGEIAGIFALAFGGAKAAGILGKKIVETEAASKLAGKFAAKKLPLVGAAIGAGTNAMMLFALGNAARHYYETKHGTPQNLRADDAQKAGDDFLDYAAQQDDVFQRVLTHVARAGYPQTTWGEVEADLRSLGLSSAALEIMKREWEAPHPLSTLLAQIDCSFSASLLAQCRRIAELDGTVTSQEQHVIQAIERHCNSVGVS